MFNGNELLAKYVTVTSARKECLYWLENPTDSDVEQLIGCFGAVIGYDKETRLYSIMTTVNGVLRSIKLRRKEIKHKDDLIYNYI